MPFFFSSSRFAAWAARDASRWYLGGFDGGVLDDLLLGRAHRVPDLLAEDHRLGVVLVVGQRDELLHFPELVRRNHRDRILLAIDRLGLQRAVDLGERHRRRVGAQRLDPVDVDRVRDHAQLQAVDVLDLVDRTLAGGDLSIAQLPVGQADDALGLEFLVQLLADRAVADGVRLLLIGEQEREVEDRQVLGQAGEDAASS